LNASSEIVASLEGLHVLAVDDRIDRPELGEFAIEGYGAEVLTVASARSAIVALTENPGRYDVLISDIGMPEEDGYFLIREVRTLAAEAGGEIPAVALTSEFQRWYKPPDLSVESIQNRKSKILKPPHLSVGSI
jgi:two-component system CheB/CheR fusion protein